MARYKDASRWTEKQIRNTKNGVEDYKAGIQSAEKDPTALAIAAAPKWVARLAESDTLARYKSGLSRSGKAKWQKNALEVGAGRISTGIEQARGDIQAFATQFGQHLSSAVPQVEAMPSTSYEDRKARAIKMMDLNHGFKRS